MGFGQVNELRALEAIERAMLHKSADISLKPDFLIIRCRLILAAHLLRQRRAVNQTLQGATGLQQLRWPLPMGQCLPLDPFQQQRGAASGQGLGEMPVIQELREIFDPLGMITSLKTPPP